MAIQTKKISELGSIQEITDETTFLGTQANVTGKISFKTIKDALAMGDTTGTVIANLVNEVENVKQNVSNIALTPAPISNPCNCAEKIAALEAKIAALESFVQALQKDGYLTLKEIQKAAADACPICNHTHEESAE